jgi:hypothetical protein
VVDYVVGSGKAWISTVTLGGQASSIRACITNYRTDLSDVEALLESLAAARAAVMPA